MAVSDNERCKGLSPPEDEDGLWISVLSRPGTVRESRKSLVALRTLVLARSGAIEAIIEGQFSIAALTACVEALNSLLLVAEEGVDIQELVKASVGSEVTMD